MKRTIILMWKGYQWQYSDLEVPNGLDKSLPDSIQKESSYKDIFTFILSGFCVDGPIYKQKD